MLARLRSWWHKTSKTLDAVVILMLVVLVALVVVIILGYANNWNWTGLRGKTLYDWLQLLIIPVVLAVGGYLFNYTTSRNEQKRTQLRDQTERDIAADNQHENLLQAYLDKMSELMLHENLLKSELDAEVRTIARILTLTVLQRLDGKRKGSVLQFLYESGLINTGNVIVDLHGANLHGANLHGANLHGANLAEVNLSGADLSSANLTNSNLDVANLISACLEAALLASANLHRAKLSEAFLQATYLESADLREAFFYSAHVWYANLSKADLRGAMLWGADLKYANLKQADLRGASMIGPHREAANLTKADLTDAFLENALFTDEQLNQAKSLKGATMPDGSKHA